MSDITMKLGSPDDTPPPEEAGLDDGAELLEPDPKPARVKGGRDTTSTRPPRKVTAKVREEVKDNLGMLLDAMVFPLSVRDPICTAAYNQQAEQIHARLAGIVCKRPKLLAWFTGEGEWLDWLGLAIALRPVAESIWRHHITHELGDEHDGEGAGLDLSSYNAPPFAAAG